MRPRLAAIFLILATRLVATAGDVPRLVLGPYVSWTAPDAALVHWETDTEVMGVVEFGETSSLGTRAMGAKAATRHAVALEGLKPNTRYFYALQFPQPGGGGRVGERFELETDFNFIPAPLPDVKPYPDDVLTKEARKIAAGMGPDDIRKTDYILDYGCGDGRLAWEIARATGATVVGVSNDAEAIARGRAFLDAAGVYGRRVTLLHASLVKLPFPDGVFDGFVSAELMLKHQAPGRATELVRVLAPGAKIPYPDSLRPADWYVRREIWDRWLEELMPAVASSAVREKLPAEKRPEVLLDIPNFLSPTTPFYYYRVSRPGAGAWSHAYGDAAQTANSGDTLVRGDAMRIQWFGQPGARGMMDRQGRNPPPLVVNDMLYTQGNRRLYAQSASNGAMRWSLEIPGLRRVNIPRDSSNMCADEESVFLAIAGRAWHLNARDGTLRSSHAAIADGSRDWGYLANVGGHIFGTTVKPASSYTRFEGGEAFWYDTFGEASTAKVCGDSIFCVEKGGGGRVWAYAKGLIIHPTISIGEGRVVFIESRNPALAAEKSSRIGSPELYKDLWLVALDATTGRVLWEKSVALPAKPTVVVLYTVLAEGKIVVVDSTDRYHVLAYDARDGAELWHKEHAYMRKDHGAHMYHPVVVRGAVIVEPVGYDLATGDVRLSGLPKRGGCSTMSAAANCVHYIDWDYDKGSMYFWDLSTDERRQVSGQRGSCWLSLISGSGMAFLPTSSSGCVCRYPNQVSVGLAPRK